MKSRLLRQASGLLMTCLLVNFAHAELYKWVGPDGKTTYSDMPPPSSAKQIETKPLISGDTPEFVLPGELAAAVAKNPVTLYVTSACNACNDGRALLKLQGIPFAEKTVTTNEDIEKLKQLSNDSQLPLLIINNSKFRGFNSAEWGNALASAGYPASNILPKNYRYPATVPAVPVRPASPPVNKEVKTPGIEQKLSPASESGIRF